MSSVSPSSIQHALARLAAQNRIRPTPGQLAGAICMLVLLFPLQFVVAVVAPKSYPDATDVFSAAPVAIFLEAGMVAIVYAVCRVLVSLALGSFASFGLPLAQSCIYAAILTAVTTVSQDVMDATQGVHPLAEHLAVLLPLSAVMCGLVELARYGSLRRRQVLPTKLIMAEIALARVTALAPPPAPARTPLPTAPEQGG